MKTALSNEDVLKHIQESIEKTGYATLTVDVPNTSSSDRLCCCYTVGLTLQGLPEIFIEGALKPETQGGLISKLIERWVEAGESFEPVYDLIPSTLPDNELKAQAVLCNAPYAIKTRMERLGHWAEQNPELEVRVVQLLWPDAANQLPGEILYEDVWGQRLLPAAVGCRWDDSILSAEDELKLDEEAAFLHQFAKPIADLYNETYEHEKEPGYWERFKAIPELDKGFDGEHFEWMVRTLLAFASSNVTNTTYVDDTYAKHSFYRALVEFDEALLLSELVFEKAVDKSATDLLRLTATDPDGRTSDLVQVNKFIQQWPYILAGVNDRLTLWETDCFRNGPVRFPEQGLRAALEGYGEYANVPVEFIGAYQLQLNKKDGGYLLLLLDPNENTRQEFIQCNADGDLKTVGDFEDLILHPQFLDSILQGINALAAQLFDEPAKE